MTKDSLPIGRFSPTKQRVKIPPIVGFDVETQGDFNKFVCCTFIDDKKPHFFWDKDEAIEHIMSRTYRGHVVSATNLSFDFFALFTHSQAQHFNMLWKGSRMLWAKTYVYKNDYHRRPEKRVSPITFLDTLNLAPYSVKKLGELIGVKKLKAPDFLGQKPVGASEKEELKIYNIQDALISKQALQWLYEGYIQLGASPKPTLASTAMSAFRNKYLHRSYWQPEENVLMWFFKGYCGGRTEAFARGTFKNYYLYDVNSLYPYVMKKYEYPDLNTLRINRKNTDKYIYQYDGMSEVKIHIPKSNYPILPYPTRNKLMFPYGTLEGRWTHAELREAMKQGATLMHVNASFYCKENVTPFKEFVDDFYNKRQEYKKKKSPMEVCAKLLMNSLYGKFGQKFDLRDNVIPATCTLEELNKYDYFDRVGDYFIVKKKCKPAPFCSPLWAAHITAYARLELHNHLFASNAIYCDTDSVITKKRLSDSSVLGKLKEEHHIDTGIIVRPKFYAFKTGSKSKIKLKGCGTYLNWKEFMRIINGNPVEYTKFSKFKESIRRGFVVNQIIDMVKDFSLNDTKREWPEPFNKNELQFSDPVHVDDIILKERRQLHPIGQVRVLQNHTLHKPDT